MNQTTTNPMQNNDYRRLIAGQIASDLGTWTSQIAFPLLFLQLTGSPLQAGISIALTNLPTFLFGLPAGAILDIYDRKKVMIVCDILRFIIIGSIPLALYFNQLTIIHLYIAVFLSGMCDVVFSNAVQSAITRIVAKDQIAKAFGQYEGIVNTASLIGPTIGGALYEIGRSFPFIVDSISYVVSALSLASIRTKFQEVNAKKSMSLKDMMQGAYWLIGHKTIWPVSYIRAIGAFVSGGQMLLLILLAKQLGASSVNIGMIVSVASIGVVLGSLSSSYIREYLGTMQALTYSRWVIAVALPLQYFSPNLILLTLTVALSYFSVAVYGTIATAYRLELVPDELQGRVNSFHRMLAFGGLAVGGALTGFMVEQLSMRLTFLIYTLLLFVLAGLLTKRLNGTINE